MAKIAAEMAEQEFERWLDAMDIYVDDTSSVEDQAQFNRHRRRIVRGIESGAIVINDDGEAIYTPQDKRTKHSEPLHWHIRDGSTAMAMDRSKTGANVARAYAMMASLCRVTPAAFAGMVGKDIKMSESLFSLLMD